MPANSAHSPKDTVILVSKDDLPLSCPRPQDQIWNMHPRVFLAVEKGDEVTCPYCGARYQLQKD